MLHVEITIVMYYVSFYSVRRTDFFFQVKAYISILHVPKTTRSYTRSTLTPLGYTNVPTRIYMFYLILKSTSKEFLSYVV